MIEGIGISLKNFYDTANNAKAILESAMDQIKANFIGAMLAEKTKEARETFNNTMSEIRNSNFDASVAILDEVLANAHKVVEMPVPTDFVSTLEALKSVKHPTAKEVETVVGAYKNNYFAYRAICDFLKVEEAGIKPVTIDDIEECVAEIRSNLHQCFFSDNVEGYHFMNWMNGTILATYDEIFTAFIEGRFEDAMNADDSKKAKEDSVVTE